MSKDCRMESSAEVLGAIPRVNKRDKERAPYTVPATIEGPFQPFSPAT